MSHLNVMCFMMNGARQFIAFSARVNEETTPTWNQAMNGPDAEGFWEAMAIEIRTLEKMEAWEVVEREVWMEVVPTTFAFRMKLTADGMRAKLKARFCVRGDKEVEGVCCDETFAPVVHWNTMRLLLTMVAQLNLESTQVDCAAAFTHAPIPKPEGHELMDEEEQKRHNMCVQLPRGFNADKPGMVLKLDKNLCGSKSAPRNWFKF